MEITTLFLELPTNKPALALAFEKMVNLNVPDIDLSRIPGSKEMIEYAAKTDDPRNFFKLGIIYAAYIRAHGQYIRPN